MRRAIGAYQNGSGTGFTVHRIDAHDGFDAGIEIEFQTLIVQLDVGQAMVLMNFLSDALQGAR